MLKYASRLEKGGNTSDRVEKIFKKRLKKVLTREKRCDIIVELPARAGSEEMVIEN